jgi:hypothetical protein
VAIVVVALVVVIVVVVVVVVVLVVVVVVVLVVVVAIVLVVVVAVTAQDATRAWGNTFLEARDPEQTFLSHETLLSMERDREIMHAAQCPRINADSSWGGTPPVRHI